MIPGDRHHNRQEMLLEREAWEREQPSIPNAVFPEGWLPVHTLARLGWLSPERADELRKEIECLRQSA